MLAEASLKYRGKQRQNANEVIRGKRIGSPKALMSSGTYRRVHAAAYRRSDYRPINRISENGVPDHPLKFARHARLVEMAVHDVARPLRDSVLHRPGLSLRREAEKRVRPLHENFD